MHTTVSPDPLTFGAHLLARFYCTNLPPFRQCCVLFNRRRNNDLLWLICFQIFGISRLFSIRGFALIHFLISALSCYCYAIHSRLGLYMQYMPGCTYLKLKAKWTQRPEIPSEYIKHIADGFGRSVFSLFHISVDV